MLSPVETRSLHQMDAQTPRLLFADRLFAVPTTGSVHQSKKYQIVAIKDTRKVKNQCWLCSLLFRGHPCCW